MSSWEVDEHSGATVSTFTAMGRAPGRVERRSSQLWRVSRHALISLVQRVEAHDALRLLYTMRELVGPVMEAMAYAKLGARDRQTLKVPFPGGAGVLEWPAGSPVAVVKTILPGPVAIQPPTRPG